MVIVGAIASILTCIMFALYVMGKIWSYMQDSRYEIVSLSIEPPMSIEMYDTFDLIADEEGLEVVLFEASENMKRITIFELNRIDTEVSEKVKLDECERIPANKKIAIKCIIPEGMPINLVEFERFDGLIGSFEIGYDGRMNGDGVCVLEYKPKRTFKSWLYHMTA